MTALPSSRRRRSRSARDCRAPREATRASGAPSSPTSAPRSAPVQHARSRCPRRHCDSWPRRLVDWQCGWRKTSGRTPLASCWHCRTGLTSRRWRRPFLRWQRKRWTDACLSGLRSVCAPLWPSARALGTSCRHWLTSRACSRRRGCFRWRPLGCRRSGASRSGFLRSGSVRARTPPCAAPPRWCRSPCAARAWSLTSRRSRPPRRSLKQH
mmetsp:Transcript_6561/g.19942  ORF Transcript_6561/g.19942 Transcript_6561/m.19942 type:complete len:211 (-) Transcript_6561:75-707(-)